ncbi:MAG TPA: TonB-dependent receptor [Ohtaekwangia sp.]|uniref:SusC/RagA family TonB-linked outer membrane protein n=1 Tax=Ohtaekwangia sp. TaxID=2066019 RepID=UPI002F94161C
MKTKLLALLMTLSLVGYGQSLLKGRVTDENDQPLPGVNVLIKGTSQGTVTDANGEYSLTNTTADAVLVLSFIGYAPQEITVGGKTSIDVKLLPDTKALQEVVVIGYGTTTQKELTGSVSVVDGQKLATLNPVRIDQALQGQAAGVQISSASGSPGGAWNIRIRGLSTNGDNNPLILVDGVPYSADGLSALNPADVESINVLKDATAGIYGVRAANGVIIITTKQGRKNSKPSLDFSGYYGVQQTTKKLDLLSAREFAVLKNEAYAAGGLTPPFSNVNLGKGTDWQDEVFQTAPIQNYNLNINGGSDKNAYSIGGSYMNQDGIVGGSKASYKRYNARLNFTTDLAPRVTLQSVLLYTNERRKTLPEMGISSVLFNTINANPAASPYNSDGTYAYLEDVTEVINPLAQMANTYNESRVNKLVGKEEITYKINNNFELSGRAGYNYAIVDDKNFSPLVYYGSGKAQNTALDGNLTPRTTAIATGVNIPIYNNVTETRSTYFNYNLEAFLNYNRSFGEFHKVKATLGTSMLANINKSLSGTGYNVPYNSNDFADISATDGANLLNNTSSWQNESRLQSFFVRGEYGFGSKYLFSALIRRDGSSNFGKNNRFGYFPAVSAAWVVSDESFFHPGIIEFMKVRASYGVSGNDKIGLFRYRALLGGEAVYPFNDQLVTGAAIGTLGNQDLKWETTHQTNFGVDFTLLNGRVDITTDYYIKKTNDLLFQPDISAISGAYAAGGSPPFVNGGDVKNSGFEFVIRYNDRVGEDFTFNIGYNLTTIRNRVTALPKGVDFYEFGSFGVGGGTATRMQVGYPMGYFFGYKTEGVYQTTQEIAERGVTQPDAKPGDLRYADVDKNGTIDFSNDTDKTIIGSPIPDVIMGLNIGMNFKGFDFATTFYASIGNEILRNYERQLPMANLLSYRMNRWTGPGSTNSEPRLTTDLTRNGVLSDYFVEDGSFVRIKNIQLGYTLPAAVSKRIGANKLRLYIAANNLATFTKYRGYDPDFSSSNPLVSGIDYGYYPQAKTYMAGLNLNF